MVLIDEMEVAVCVTGFESLKALRRLTGVIRP